MELFDSDTSDSDIELLQLDPNIRRIKYYKPRINFGLDDFQARYRLTRAQFEIVLLDVAPRIQHPTGKSAAVSPEHQLLVTMRFLATGSFYHLVGDAHGFSKGTVSNCIRRCITAINTSLFAEHVRWIDNNTARKFYEVGGMPAIAGCIDGTHVKIEAPNENEHQFVNRNGYHSINAMCVCGPNRLFCYVSARWPGSVNDARVLRTSSLFNRCENGWRPFPNAVILGDSAYPLKDWIVPPLLNPNTPAEERFNVAHKRTRRLIENAFGILKERFACLHQGLRVQPMYACEIIKACCTLHNICGEADNDAVFEEIVDADIVLNDANQQGLDRRANLVNHFV